MIQIFRKFRIFLFQVITVQVILLMLTMGNLKGKSAPNEFEAIRSDTNFKESEIEDWYRWYKSVISDCPGKRMDIVEFKKIYSRMYPSGVEDKYVEHVFRSFDTNGDEVIDFREFMVSLYVTARGTLTQKLEWAFKVYDINGDGFITRNEMLEIFLAMHKMIGEPKCCSEDASKSIESLVDDIIRRLDKDLDGKLSLEEFVEGSKNNPTVISKLSQINRKSSLKYSSPIIL